MTNKKDLISVIIPIYNVEQYLERCIKSVIEQSYNNLEIILVDDGSKDNCGKICDDYSNKDSRIKVIHKENGGLSEARNVAIDSCKGKYISFIDSDDFVHKDYILNMYTDLCKANADIATCSYQSFYEESDICDNIIFEERQVYNNEQALKLMLYQIGTTTSACGKIYDKKLFEKVRYPVGEICEDLATTYKLFMKAKTITFSTNKLYYYLQRRESIINSKFSIKRMKALEFAKTMVDDIVSEMSNIEKAAKNRLFMEAIFIIIKIPRKEYKEEQRKLLNVIKQNRRIVLRDKNSKKGYRVIALLSYFGITPVKFIFYIKSKVGVI